MIIIIIYGIVSAKRMLGFVLQQLHVINVNAFELLYCL